MSDQINQCNMESIDVYDDLDQFISNTTNDDVLELRAKNDKLEAELKEIKHKNNDLSLENYNLKEKISSLMLTAKSEIKRKNLLISSLREEHDNLAFRRRRPFDYRSHPTSDGCLPTNQECHDIKNIHLNKDHSTDQNSERFNDNYINEINSNDLVEKSTIHHRLGKQSKKINRNANVERSEASELNIKQEFNTKLLDQPPSVNCTKSSSKLHNIDSKHFKSEPLQEVNNKNLSISNRSPQYHSKYDTIYNEAINKTLNEWDCKVNPKRSSSESIVKKKFTEDQLQNYEIAKANIERDIAKTAKYRCTEISEHANKDYKHSLETKAQSIERGKVEGNESRNSRESDKGRSKERDIHSISDKDTCQGSEKFRKRQSTREINKYKSNKVNQHDISKADTCEYREKARKKVSSREIDKGRSNEVDSWKLSKRDIHEDPFNDRKRRRSSREIEKSRTNEGVNHRMLMKDVYEDPKNDRKRQSSREIDKSRSNEVDNRKHSKRDIYEYPENDRIRQYSREIEKSRSSEGGDHRISRGDKYENDRKRHSSKEIDKSKSMEVDKHKFSENNRYENPERDRKRWSSRDIAISKTRDDKYCLERSKGKSPESDRGSQRRREVYRYRRKSNDLTRDIHTFRDSVERKRWGSRESDAYNSGGDNIDVKRDNLINNKEKLGQVQMHNSAQERSPYSKFNDKRMREKRRDCISSHCESDYIVDKEFFCVDEKNYNIEQQRQHPTESTEPQNTITIQQGMLEKALRGSGITEDKEVCPENDVQRQEDKAVNGSTVNEATKESTCESMTVDELCVNAIENLMLQVNQESNLQIANSNKIDKPKKDTENCTNASSQLAESNIVNKSPFKRTFLEEFYYSTDDEFDAGSKSPPLNVYTIRKMREIAISKATSDHTTYLPNQIAHGKHTMKLVNSAMDANVTKIKRIDQKKIIINPVKTKSSTRVSSKMKRGDEFDVDREVIFIQESITNDHSYVPRSTDHNTSAVTFDNKSNKVYNTSLGFVTSHNESGSDINNAASERVQGENSDQVNCEPKSKMVSEDYKKLGAGNLAVSAECDGNNAASVIPYNKPYKIRESDKKTKATAKNQTLFSENSNNSNSEITATINVRSPVKHNKSQERKVVKSAKSVKQDTAIKNRKIKTKSTDDDNQSEPCGETKNDLKSKRESNISKTDGDTSMDKISRERDIYCKDKLRKILPDVQAKSYGTYIDLTTPVTLHDENVVSEKDHQISVEAISRIPNGRNEEFNTSKSYKKSKVDLDVAHATGDNNDFVKKNNEMNLQEAHTKSPSYTKKSLNRDNNNGTFAAVSDNTFDVVELDDDDEKSKSFTSISNTVTAVDKENNVSVVNNIVFNESSEVNNKSELVVVPTLSSSEINVPFVSVMANNNDRVGVNNIAISNTMSEKTNLKPETEKRFGANATHVCEESVDDLVSMANLGIEDCKITDVEKVDRCTVSMESEAINDFDKESTVMESIEENQTSNISSLINNLDKCNVPLPLLSDIPLSSAKPMQEVASAVKFNGRNADNIPNKASKRVDMEDGEISDSSVSSNGVPDYISVGGDVVQGSGGGLKNILDLSLEITTKKDQIILDLCSDWSSDCTKSVASPLSLNEVPESDTRYIAVSEKSRLKDSVKPAEVNIDQKSTRRLKRPHINYDVDSSRKRKKKDRSSSISSVASLEDSALRPLNDSPKSYPNQTEAFREEASKEKTHSAEHDNGHHADNKEVTVEAIYPFTDKSEESSPRKDCKRTNSKDTSPADGNLESTVMNVADNQNAVRPNKPKKPSNRSKTNTETKQPDWALPKFLVSKRENGVQGLQRSDRDNEIAEPPSSTPATVPSVGPSPPCFVIRRKRSLIIRK